MAPIASTATEALAGAQVRPLAIPAPTLLRLMWLASPALPVGGFSYSEGLEAAVDAGWVSDEASAGQWLLAQMALSQARSDWPVCAQAHRAWHANDAAAVEALNAWVLHTRESAEFRLQTEQMGRSLAEWLKRGDGLTPQAGQARVRLGAAPSLDISEALGRLSGLSPAPTWPVAFALAGVLCGATAEETTLACAFGWAENMAQAAIKAVPLGQSAAQRVLQQLLDALPAHLEAAVQRTPGHGPIAPQQSFAPMLAILSAQHEVQYSRLFRS